MPKEEWGTKRLCPHCATRFYDLQADPMTCPACGAEFTLESLLNTGRGKTMASDKASARSNSSTDDDEVLDDDDDLDDDSGDLDDDLLEDDDDDDVSLDDIADVASEDDDT